MSAFTEVATAVKTAFETEFAAEQLTMVFDNLHPSLGRTRVDVGIAPTEENPRGRDMNVQEHYVEVRFYDLWTQKISPEVVVNPTKITDYAERFKRCLRDVSTPGTDTVWYFDVTRIRYPDDPTGNKTRFVATIRAFGRNSNLVETAG